MNFRFGIRIRISNQTNSKWFVEVYSIIIIHTLWLFESIVSNFWLDLLFSEDPTESFLLELDTLFWDLMILRLAAEMTPLTISLALTFLEEEDDWFWSFPASSNFSNCFNNTAITIRKKKLLCWIHEKTNMM